MEFISFKCCWPFGSDVCSPHSMLLRLADCGCLWKVRSPNPYVAFPLPWLEYIIGSRRGENNGKGWHRLQWIWLHFSELPASRNRNLEMCWWFSYCLCEPGLSCLNVNFLTSLNIYMWQKEDILWLFFLMSVFLKCYFHSLERAIWAPLCCLSTMSSVSIGVLLLAMPLL